MKTHLNLTRITILKKLQKKRPTTTHRHFSLRVSAEEIAIGKKFPQILESPVQFLLVVSNFLSGLAGGQDRDIEGILFFGRPRPAGAARRCLCFFFFFFFVDDGGCGGEIRRLLVAVFGSWKS